MTSVGDGPIFFMYSHKANAACVPTWWLHLLYINNIDEISDKASSCMGWTWYLPNDMQFFLLVPLIVYLLYHRRTVGLAFVCAYQVVSYGLTMYSVIEHDLNPSHFKAGANFDKYFYHRPFARIGPFTIGVVTALMLYSYHNDAANSNATKRAMDVINSNVVVRATMYVVGAALMLLMVFAYYPIDNHADELSKTFNALFLTFSSSLFVLGMTLLLLPALIGRNRAANWFLSLDVFTPLARLTFGAYLVHPAYMLFYSFNTQRGEFTTINQGIMNFIVWLVAAFATSVVCTLLIESPCMKLEKTILIGGDRKKHAQKKEVLLENDERSEKAIRNDGKAELLKMTHQSSINKDDSEGIIALS